jgi:hypothetical protein
MNLNPTLLSSEGVNLAQLQVFATVDNFDQQGRRKNLLPRACSADLVAANIKLIAAI